MFWGGGASPGGVGGERSVPPSVGGRVRLPFSVQAEPASGTWPHGMVLNPRVIRARSIILIQVSPSDLYTPQLSTCCRIDQLRDKWHKIKGYYLLTEGKSKFPGCAENTWSRDV